MHFSILAPGLLWPDPVLSDTVVGLQLPALQALLGRGRIARQAGDEAHWLQTAFGIDALPAAPLRLLGDGGAPGSTQWLCADPISYGFSQQGIQLADPATLALTDAEQSALMADLAPLLNEFGTYTVSPTGRGYLESAVPLADFPPRLDTLTGAPAHALLPGGDNGRPWRRLLNDVQITLHHHPVNQTREAAKKAPVSSLALWGGGRLPAAPDPSKLAFDALFSNDPVHLGLAQHVGIAGCRLDEAVIPANAGMTGRSEDAAKSLDSRLRGNEGTSHSPTNHFAQLPLGNRLRPLLHLDTFQQPTQQRDALAWRTALEQLEAAWIAPALAALRRGQIKRLSLIALGEGQQMHITLSRLGRLQVWRRPQTLTALHP